MEFPPGSDFPIHVQGDGEYCLCLAADEAGDIQVLALANISFRTCRTKQELAKVIADGWEGARITEILAIIGRVCMPAVQYLNTVMTPREHVTDSDLLEEEIRERLKQMPHSYSAAAEPAAAAHSR